MIVSHRHRFIFIRAPKTASTSLQVALARHCGPEDIVSDVRLEKTELALKRTKYRGSGLVQNHRPNNPDKIAAHAFPEDIIRHFGRRVWDVYYKIVVVRNPWDQAYSEHNFSPKVRLNREFGYSAQSAWKYYFVGDEDFGNGETGRYLIFEDLNAEYEKLCKFIGVNCEDLPRCKTTYRKPETRDYRRYYNDEMRSLIDNSAKRIIDYFGYEFDRPGEIPKFNNSFCEATN